MDLFSRARAQVRTSQPRASLENPNVPISAASIVEFLGGQYGSHSGKTVTPKTAVSIPAVWRAVNLISTTCAGLPIGAYRKGEDAAPVEVTSGAAAQLLADPHPDMTPLEVWELVYGSLALWGNGYLRKLSDQLGTVRELWWIPPNTIQPSRSKIDASKTYEVDGESRTLTDREILHIPGWGYDGIQGMSPIRAAREGLGLAMAAEEFGARLFGSGSLSAGLLTTEQKIDKDQAIRLKELWREGGTGLDSAHDIRVMGSGAKFQQLTIPPEDAQFLQTRNFSVDEIARIFGIPPHLLMQVDKTTSWGTGIESQNIALITYTLSGYLKRVEQRLTKALKPQPLYVKYNLNGLLRGDSASRGQFYQLMWGIGALSTNDIRQLEEQAPVEGGDVRYRPLNYGVLGSQTPTEPETPKEPGTAPATEPATEAADA